MGFECGRCGAGFVTQACVDIHARQCSARAQPSPEAKRKRCSCIDAQRAYLNEQARRCAGFAGPRQGLGGERIPGAQAHTCVMLGTGAVSPCAACTETMREMEKVITRERAFTRAEVLLALRAIEASRGGVTEAITAFERME